MSSELRRREKVVAAAATVFAALSPADLRLRFGAGTGAEWLLDDLRADARHRAYVARDGRLPVAVLDTARGEGEIEIGVAVAPSHRRRGIATRMLRRIITRDDGETLPFVGYCLPENVPAAALLRSAGFVCTGNSSGYLRFVSLR